MFCKNGLPITFCGDFFGKFFSQKVPSFAGFWYPAKKNICISLVLVAHF